MRIAPVLATMLFGLSCSGALALDDTPTYAPHLQARADDGRAVIRPSGAIAAVVAVAAGKRDARPVVAPRTVAAGAAPAPAPVPAPRPAVAPSGAVVEKPSWKLQ